jgi:hypothetical protein
MISAASHQVIFFAMAFSSTSCSFIIRSISAAVYCLGVFNPSSVAAAAKRTDHV